MNNGMIADKRSSESTPPEISIGMIYGPHSYMGNSSAMFRHPSEDASMPTEYVSSPDLSTRNHHISMICFQGIVLSIYL